MTNEELDAIEAEYAPMKTGGASCRVKTMLALIAQAREANELRVDAERMWRKPSEALPVCEVGDRIVIIVNERERADLNLRRRLVLLTATESGWYSDEDFYAGYSVDDGERWAYERDVIEAANPNERSVT